ncbi:hypothetical protein KSP39_PZI003932 [Platanthera zijinensis]|uniref:Uncharacterized protein n=1 Tax=Platanthera zijinensis TaxID=2320716 RepID=A0AAP0GD57_9ASPA
MRHPIPPQPVLELQRHPIRRGFRRSVPPARDRRRRDGVRVPQHGGIRAPPRRQRERRFGVRAADGEDHRRGEGRGCAAPARRAGECSGRGQKPHRTPYNLAKEITIGDDERLRGGGGEGEQILPEEAESVVYAPEAVLFQKPLDGSLGRRRRLRHSPLSSADHLHSLGILSQKLTVIEAHQKVIKSFLLKLVCI